MYFEEKCILKKLYFEEKCILKETCAKKKNVFLRYLEETYL